MERSSGWNGDLEFRVLGAIDARIDGVTIDIGGPTQRRLLSALLVDAGRVVGTDALIDRVWDDDDRPAEPEKALRTYVSRFRKSLNDAGAAGDAVLVTEPPGYRLAVGDEQIDSGRFAHLVAAAVSDTRPADAVDTLDGAEALWRGQPYLEFDDRVWVEAEAARLVELHAVALEERASRRLELGAHAEVVGDLDQLVQADPLRTRPVELLMTALFRSGRQAESLRVAERHRRELAEVGLEPSPAFLELETRVVAGDASLLLTDTGTESLRAYELAEQIGEGAFSIVYRGVQPSLGREVAIKQIRSELANRPEFIRRFEAEARMVAALEHPHIVPLYDFWREPGAAFLVMRWLRGGTLESLLRERQLDLSEAVEMTEQVGAALAAAHAAGVVHRDVKTPNIFLDDAGNYYLGDFGIAVDTQTRHDPEALLSAGSPAYASPEQLRREPVGPTSDVHSLGIVLYEALTGRLPFPDEPSQAALLQRQLNDPIPPVRNVRPDVPPGVDDIIGRATTKRPEDRYPSVADFVEALDAATSGPGSPSTPTISRGARTLVGDATNPYKGLRAFQESDAEDFFGRDRLVDRLVEQLTAAGPAGRLVAAVGPSGSGKSSVVRAGLLPRLREGALPGSSAWFVTSMIPGANPFEELEAALSRIAVAPTTGLVETMRSDRRGIARAVKAVLPDETSEVLLLVDQFEEVFTLVADDRVRHTFIEGLTDAISDPRSRLRVVVTIRADFWDRPLRHPDLARILETSAVTVTPLAADELERAIVDPALRVGVELEPGLAPVIAADVQDQPGALPLLQYAMTELFDRNVSGLMRLDDYRDLGGVAGALARRAEELYQVSTEPERTACRALFGRLVTPGEGTEDTRRRALRSELATSAEAETVLDRYDEARLLSFDHDPATREPTVEVAHEALIRGWPRLRGWLDEDRDRLRIHRHLTLATTGWLAAEKDDSELYRGGRLEAAESLADDPAALTDAEADFLRASVDQRSGEAEAERRRLRRLRRLALTTAIVAVIALAAGAIALAQWNRADDNAADAEANAALAATEADEADQARRVAQEAEAAGDRERMIALGRSADPSDPTVGILLAVEAHRAEPSFETLDAIHRALTTRSGFMGSLPSEPLGVELTQLDDGERFVTHTATTIDLWNVRTRELEGSWPFPGASGSRFDLHTSAASDGSVVAATAPAQTTVLSLIDGTIVAEIPHPTAATAVATTADGARVAIGFADGSVEVWSTGATPELLATRPSTGAEVGALSWSPDRQHLAVGSFDSTLVLWEPSADRDLWTHGDVGDNPAAENGAWGLLFSSDGERLVVSTQTDPEAAGANQASGVRALEVLRTADGQSLLDQPIPDPWYRTNLAWRDQAEEVVIAGSAASSVAVFDIGAGVRRDDLVDKPGLGGALGVFPDLGLAVVAGGRSIELRSLDGSGPLSRAVPLAPAQTDFLGPRTALLAAFDTEGRRFVTSAPFAFGSVAHVVDLSEPILVPVPFVRAGEDASPTAVDSFGPFTLQGDAAFNTFIFDGLDGGALGPPVPFTGGFGVALSPLGDRLVLYDANDDPLLFDVATGELITKLEDLPRFAGNISFTAASFSPDGSVVHTHNGAGAARYDAQTGERIWVTTDFGWTYPGPADEWMAVVTAQDELELRDPATFDLLAGPLIGHIGQATWLETAPSGRLMATTGRDSTVRVWDVASGKQLGASLPVSRVFKAIWSPDGTTLAVPGETGITLWNFDTDSWADIACEVAGRNLTAAEWDEVGPRTIDRRPTCPQHASD